MTDTYKGKWADLLSGDVSSSKSAKVKPPLAMNTTHDFCVTTIHTAGDEESCQELFEKNVANHNKTPASQGMGLGNGERNERS